MNGYTVGVIALLLAALSLSMVIDARTRQEFWRRVLAYWLCAMVASVAIFGLTPLSTVLGWLASTVILVILGFVLNYLHRNNELQPPTHHPPH